MSDWGGYVYIDLGLAKKVINSMHVIGVTPPVSGEITTVEGIKFQEEGIKVLEAQWEEPLGKVINDDSYTYVKNKEYFLYVKYQLEEGYALSPSISANDCFANGMVETERLQPKYMIFIYTTMEYTVNFNVDGGSEVLNQIVKSGGLVSKPADPIKSGYSFDGWYSDVEKVTPFDFSIPITEDTTIYAKWVEKKYTVSFNANGGTGSMSSITQTENSKYTLPSNGFTAPSGKLFKCWSVNGVEKNVGSVITITSDITIKAVWKDSIVAISKTSISITNQYYTGKAINYNPVIKYNGKTLKLNIDYTLSYTNNIKLGTATVVIKGIGNYNGSVTKTFKIVIAPVSGLVTTAQTTSSISLKWNKNNLVDGYEVYYATSKNGKYKKATTITKNGTVTYKKSSLKAGTTYYFKIRSYKKISGVKKYSDYSSVIIGNTIPAKVTIKTPTVAGSTVTVKWSKQATATGYEVYSSTTKNGTYKLEKNITGASNVSLSISNLIPGKTYYYKVRSYRVVEGKKYYGAYSKVTSKKVSLPGKVTQLTPTVKNGIVTIKWKKVSNVSGYEIQMSTDKKNYTLLETVKNPSQVKSITEGFEKGKTYYLKIRAYILVNGTKYYGSYSAVKSVKIK